MKTDPLTRRYFDSREAFHRTYKGLPAIKCPMDLWAVQEIIHDTKPDLLIETGTFGGGSAHFYADLGVEVVTIDLEVREARGHPRITFFRGSSSINPEVLDALQWLMRGRRTMVCLDSDHSKAHVTAELNAYSRFVSAGCYLIVEDTNPAAYTALGLDPDDSPGAALKAWQPTNRGFEVDRAREQAITFNPGGFLKRVR